MCFLSVEWAMSSGAMMQGPRWWDTSPEVSICVTENIGSPTCNCHQLTLYLPEKTLLIHLHFHNIQDNRFKITHTISSLHRNADMRHILQFLWFYAAKKLWRQEVRSDRWKKWKRRNKSDRNVKTDSPTLDLQLLQTPLFHHWGQQSFLRRVHSDLLRCPNV